MGHPYNNERFLDKSFLIFQIYAILPVSPKGIAMPAPAKPVQFVSEEHERAQRIFARLIAGESIRAIAASETLSVRRVQQIVREQLDRRDADPADDFALLQIARLERALDLVGAQIDAGKASAAHAYVRILDHLSRLAPERLRLRATFQKAGGEVDKMADRLGRLDAAREALAARQASPGFHAHAAKPNPAQAVDNKGNGETADSPPPIFSEA